MYAIWYIKLKTLGIFVISESLITMKAANNLSKIVKCVINKWVSK